MKFQCTLAVFAHIIFQGYTMLQHLQFNEKFRAPFGSQGTRVKKNKIMKASYMRRHPTPSSIRKIANTMEGRNPPNSVLPLCCESKNTKIRSSATAVDYKSCSGVCMWPRNETGRQQRIHTHTYIYVCENCEMRPNEREPLRPVCVGTKEDCKPVAGVFLFGGSVLSSLCVFSYSSGTSSPILFYSRCSYFRWFLNSPSGLR